MKVVKKYTSLFSANLAKGMLESAGIQAQVLNQNINFVTGTFNSDLLSIELVVNDDDYSMASKLLAASSSEE
ncbi:MAG: DUF2007 domain-containing protein [Bacteroidales bacterium]